jgi:hypothetical protein
MRADAHINVCVDRGHGQLWFCGDPFGRSLREIATASDTISPEKGAPVYRFNTFHPIQEKKDKHVTYNDHRNY